MGRVRYREVLRDAMDAAGSSRRKLSAALAERTGNQQTSEYRALGKYLAGDEEPSRPRATILAELLSDERLAEVSDRQDRRDARLASIEAELAALKESRELGTIAISVRLDDLEADLDELKQQLARRSSDTSGAK